MSELVVTFATYRHGRFVRRDSVAQNIIKLGRDRKSHVWLDDDAAARLHAVVEVASASELWLIDLGNEPGTALNGARVERAALKVGDCVRIGTTDIVLEGVSARPVAVEAAAAVSASARAPEAEGYTYALLKRGPDIAADEVELPGVRAVEVIVLWGKNVLHVAHLSPPRNFYVGEQRPEPHSNDFLIPYERLGTTRLPVVIADDERMSVVIPAQATGEIEHADQRRLSLEQARAEGAACAEHAGAVELELRPGARARIELGQIVFLVANVRAGKPIPHGLASGMDWKVPLYFASSCLSMGGLIATLAFFVPPLGLSDDEGLDADRMYLIQQYLQAAAERETQEELAPAAEDAQAGGGSTEAAAGAQGAMGKPEASVANHRYAVKGPADNPEPSLSKREQVQQATTFGMIGLLNSGELIDPDAPTSPWATGALGKDPLSAQGNLWGDDIGAAWGINGLAPSGQGDGGGGVHEGVPGGGITSLTEGNGLGPPGGKGWSQALRARPHGTRVPQMRTADVSVSGRLPGDTIQRIVRQSYGRFRFCYEQGLLRNPNLEGHVSVRFVINREGAVASVADGGSDLPDSSVAQCVVRAFYGLSFPPPEGGIVTVVYPLHLQPQ